jgi:hypothetical protein
MIWTFFTHFTAFALGVITVLVYGGVMLNRLPHRERP